MLASPETQRASVSVLVVDDHPENRTALRAILSPVGYRLVEVGSSAEALLRLLEEEFAVLLIDVVMPGMDGFELAAAIRGRERTATVPIVFLTAEAVDLALVSKGYSVGGVDYLLKPVVPEVVRAKVGVFAQLYRQRKFIEEQATLLVASERKDAELRLLELRLASERRYQTLAELVPHIVWTARPDGVVDYFNQRWFEYTGLAVNEAAGSWLSALHGEDLERCRGEWQSAVRSGQTFQTECRLRRASDGAYRWHLGRAVPERRSTGQIEAWLGTFTDIDDQKHIQAILEEFKGTLDAEPDAVIIFDPESLRIVYVNEGTSALLGYSREELLTMRPADFLVDYDHSGFRALLGPLLDGSKTVVALETKFRRRDAHAAALDVAVQLIRIGGDRVAEIARDITDRKRTQEEREVLYQQAVEAVRARDEFLSVASHELRTPLSSLQLQIGMLLRPPPSSLTATLGSKEARSKVETAARQADRMARLITELMDVSRINAGRLHLELEDLDLVTVVRDVVGRLADDAAKARCPIEIDARSPSVTGRWDRLRIEQVVTNLLTNAFKFAAGKPIEITLEEDGALGRIIIADRGVGIAPEDVERIFKRYEQASPSRRHAGLGLGLYIVRQIVEAHGGTIRVASRPGEGSVFTVELPRQPPAPAAEAAK
jgi:PAS domain S-box-containing protein